MEWYTVKNIFYGMQLAALGTGAVLLLFRKKSEIRQSSTLRLLLRSEIQRASERFKTYSLFSGVRAAFRQEWQTNADLEIYDSMLLLKNLALAEKEQAFSADYIYEALMQHAKRLKPIYAQMLTLYRSGKDKDAFRYLADQCGSRAGKNFSMVLSKVDQIHPDALAEQMDVFIEIMSQQRMTSEMKKVQRNSLFTTVAATAAVFISMIDFAVVVVFMHTMTLMEQAF